MKVLPAAVQEAAATLRHALQGLILDAGSNPDRPQEVHRRFGIDRVLCWKISRLVSAERAEDALRQLPTPEAFGTYVAGFERAGVPVEAGRRVQEAVRVLNEALKEQVGDRGTLELMLDGAVGGRDTLQASRKLAFRGNSGIWGVQARVRYDLILLAPGDEDWVDTAFVNAWLDFKRLRPDAPWRLFKHRMRNTPNASPPPQPLDPTQAPDGPMLVTQFCDGVPPLLMRTEGPTVHCDIGPSVPGAAGAFDMVTGFVQRRHGSRFARQPGGIAEMGSTVLAPVEHLIVDLLVHESLQLWRDATMYLSSAAFNDGSERNAYTRVPIEPERKKLGQPAILVHPELPDVTEWARCVFEAGGWQREHFTGLRFQMAWPPFPSVGVIELPLAARS